MSKFDELKMKATAATQLPWEVTGHTVYALEHDSWRKGVEQMRNRFSFSVQRGPDTPESELQAIAEFCQAANPAAILELLAIQAQLVEVLSHPALYELLGNVEDSMDSATWSKAVVFMEARDAALAAAGAQP